MTPKSRVLWRPANEAASAGDEVLDRLRRFKVRYILREHGAGLSADLQQGVRVVASRGHLDSLELQNDPVGERREKLVATRRAE